MMKIKIEADLFNLIVRIEVNEAASEAVMSVIAPRPGQELPPGHAHVPLAYQVSAEAQVFEVRWQKTLCHRYTAIL